MKNSLLTKFQGNQQLIFMQKEQTEYLAPPPPPHEAIKGEELSESLSSEKFDGAVCFLKVFRKENQIEKCI